MHMAAINLAPPAIAYFDLPVAGRCSVSDDEVIGKTVLHAADMLVIIIEYARVSLPGAAIVHHNELPATLLDRRASNGFDDRLGKISIVG